MAKFGLIGHNIEYSFSRGYFASKFEKENLPHTYENFDIDNITSFTKIIQEQPLIGGLNVTIPYKEVIIPYLDELDKTAEEIGAVNTIKFLKNNKLKGFNTDYYGFKTSLQRFLKPHHKSALILGTGGASKAIAYALKKLGVSISYVSRKSSKGIDYTYKSLTKDVVSHHQIIINCTPLGTYPNIEDSPQLPYQAINNYHLLFDLIYNPEETQFLKLGKQNGATISNGLNMLELQAEKAWDIWMS